MIDTLYIEESVRDHARVRALGERFATARRIRCETYGEVFNRKAQHFALQKRNPALMLAHKRGNLVLPAPAGYGVGGARNFYFSHMLNCLYDCRYCFLQGMYRSAHYVLFVNYEDFDAEIARECEASSGRETWFFSGYDCDSLALEPVTGYVAHLLRAFPYHEHCWLELRTKSTQVRTLLEAAPRRNWVVAFSLAPQSVIEWQEHKTPSLERRLAAIERLQQHGWRVGLRFDPLLLVDDFQNVYGDFFDQVFRRVKIDSLHSVSLGAFRVPKPFFDNMVRWYPQESLFAQPLVERDRLVRYPAEMENAALTFCSDTILRHVPENLFFPCRDDG